MFKHFLITFFLLIFFRGVSAQEQGTPFIKNYTQKEVATQNWAVVQDNRGVIYIGNNTGVVEYDGNEWRTIPVQNNTAAHSLAIDSSGTIYVGAVGEFGMLIPYEKGELRYKSLSDKLPETERTFANVWQTHAGKDFVYFGTSQALFRYNIKTSEVKIWKAGENNFHVFFHVYDKLYIRQWNKGLMTLEGDEIVPVREGNIFSDERIYVMLPYEENKILIGTRTKGFLLFSPDKEKNNEHGLFKSFPIEAEDYLVQHQLYHGSLLPNNGYALATNRGGVIIIDQKGKIKNIINKKNQLQDDFVLYTFADVQQGLWIALNSGISRVESSTPITSWNENSGLKGIIESIKRHKNKIYVATSVGVFCLDKDIFSPVEGIEAQSWDLAEVGKEADTKLLAATSTGVYEIKDNEAKLISSGGSATKLYVSGFDKSLVYIGLTDGLYSARYDAGKFIINDRIKNLNAEVITIAEDQNRNIWLSTPLTGVIKCSEGKVVAYDTTHGLPSLKNIRIFKVAGEKLLFATEAGIYSFNEKNRKFELHNLHSQLFSSSQGVYQVSEDKGGDLWLNLYNTDKNWIEFAKKNKTGFARDSLPFKRLPSIMIQSLYPDETGCWIGSDEGLYYYYKNTDKNFRQPFQTLIRKVTLTNDSLLFAGAYLPELLSPQLSYSKNSLTFYFAAAAYENESSNLFSYFLEGYDKEWSAFASSVKKEYTNLPEGNYKFRVKAKNIYGIEGDEAGYEFKIFPPWYRTAWAYIAYFLLFVGLLYLAIAISVRRLKRAKIKLEEIVKERTAEIVHKNIELQEQKEEIEYKKKEITDSINYAQRIQRAILSPVSDIQKVLPESFVLYKPKDIVSGDFYWFEDVNTNAKESNNRILIAAVDCTGHGVPGAFMSMIGSEKLNYAAKLSTDPGKILQILNRSVKSALRQSANDESTRDGMDVALCAIDKEEKKLYYSGANRPLWIIRNENNSWNIHEWKATKSAIGGTTSDSQVFDTHLISLQNNDRIYIFTDGYADQFGGDKGKKLMTRQFKNFLISIQDLSMAEQEKILDSHFNEWKNSFEQVDDVLVIGIKI